MKDELYIINQWLNGENADIEALNTIKKDIKSLFMEYEKSLKLNHELNVAYAVQCAEDVLEMKKQPKNGEIFIKPCPFCGGYAIFEADYHYKDLIKIICKICFATSGLEKISFDYSAKDKCVEAWNKRTQ